MILSMGYLGQLLGAILFGWLAEKIGATESSAVHNPLVRQHGCGLPVRRGGDNDDGIPFRPRESALAARSRSPAPTLMN